MYIYCLASEDTIWYVGKTNHWEERERAHRNKSAKTCAADAIPDGTIWEMIRLDEVADEDGADAERFYYEYLEPLVNKNVPGRSRPEGKKEWEAQNRQKRREYQRRSYFIVKAKRAALRANLTEDP
jgi:hypothetical protein